MPNNYMSAGVYVQERDLSQVVPTVSTSTGAIVLYASKGPINTRTLITNTQQLINTFGKPSPSYGFGLYAALAFLQKANQLYVVRVLDGSYNYAGAMLSVDPTQYTPSIAGQAVFDPINNPPAFSGNQQLFLYVNGPGSYGNNIQLSISSNSLNVPNTPTSAVTLGTGSLAAGTYTYVITASNAYGESAQSANVAATLSSTGQVTLSWIPTAPIGTVTLYKVYRLVGATYNYVGSTSGVTTATPLTYLDNGSVTPLVGVNPPVSGYVTPIFSINVFDSTVSTTLPVESWPVTFVNGTDGYGQQTEVVSKINTFSTYIKAIKNPAGTFPAGVKPTTASVNLGGGTDGNAYSSVAAGTFTAGWSLFADKEQATVRILIEGGTQNQIIQRYMDQLAQNRMDCVAILDLPTAYQETSAALNYRQNVLNISTNYSAIYGPDVYVNDSYNDMVLYVPPSGYVAAVYAYTDFTAQTWFAPAGLTRGLLGSMGVLSVRYKYNQAQRDLLASAQLNYLRNFPGIDIAVFEQLTLQAKTSALSYVSVRRLLIAIEVAVQQALLYSTHEPNDEFLRREIITLISSFLQGIKNNRGLQSFAVIADTSNNPPAVYNNGQLNVDVYILPVLPATKIQLQMIVTKQGVSFQELIANGGVA